MRHPALKRGAIYMLMVLCSVSYVFSITPKQLCDKVAEQFRSRTIEVNFTVSYSENRSTGTLIMDKEKFVLITDYAKTWYDGKTQWTYLPSTEEVNVSVPSLEEVQNINPYYLLSLYQRGYSASILNEKGNNYELALNTTNKNAEIQKINITVSKSNYLPVQISFVRKNKEKTVVKVNSFKQGINVSNETFIFHAKDYPEAEIIDLR